MRANEVWAHSRETSTKPGRTVGARCALLEIRRESRMTTLVCQRYRRLRAPTDGPQRRSARRPAAARAIRHIEDRLWRDTDLNRADPPDSTAYRSRPWLAAIIPSCRPPHVYQSKVGETAEWLKEHAWKSIPSARADARQIPPTHFRSMTSRKQRSASGFPRKS